MCMKKGNSKSEVLKELIPSTYANSVHTLKRLGAALARHTGSDEREVIGQLMQRISLHLMRGNAGMITSRCPEADFLPPELDGVE